MKTAVLFSLVLVTMASSAPASDLIRKACLKSDRPAVTVRLCACIQQVADQRLEPRDQRLAASFFRNPQKAQRIRQSDNARYSVFWQRYRQWGEAAEKACSGRE